MPKPKITESDLCRAAKRLRTSTAEVETVAEVESRGEAFYADGFPVILFERHKFRKFTEGRFDGTHPHLSNRKAGGYGKAGQNQVNKFNQAFALDPIAAMKSCSWGKFQIMGFNYAMCGYDSVGEFVDAMKESEGKQLDAFVDFVISAGLADELRAHKWEAFAEGYNGPTYRKNNYHIKLPAAFKKFSKRKIHCGQLSAAPPANNPQVIHDKGDQTANTHSEAPPDFTGGAAIVDSDADTDSGAAPGATYADAAMSPQVIDKERPSLFTRVMTAIIAAIASAIAAVTTTCGGNEVANMVARQGAERIVQNAERSDLQTFGLVVAYIVVGLGAAILLFYIASKIWEKSSERANKLNLLKTEVAADKLQNTVEFKAKV